MNKKLWIGLGAAVTAVSPIVTVVACGNGHVGTPGGDLTDEVLAKNLNQAVSDVKSFEMSAKTIAEIKANALTEGKTLKESDVTSNGITLPKLPKGISRKVTVKSAFSELSNTFNINVELSSKNDKKVASTIIMAKDGGVKEINILSLASSLPTGLFDLPITADPDKMSLKRIIIDILDQRQGHFGKYLSGLLGDAYNAVTDLISMPQFATVIKLAKTGLSSFNYKDVNDIKVIISNLFGNEYTGDVKILEALVNGVQNEKSTNGKLTELPKMFTELLTKLIKSIPGGNDMFGNAMLIKSITPIISSLSERLSGSWNNFLNNLGTVTKIDDLKYAQINPATFDPTNNFQSYNDNYSNYETKIKEAIKRNIAILGNNILSVPLLSGKSILADQTSNELQKTLAYLQSIVQKLIVYLNYEDQSIESEGQSGKLKISTATIRTILMMLPDGKKPLEILGSQALLKLATVDITKPLNINLFAEKDFKFLAELFNMLIAKTPESQLTGKNLQAIFTVLVDGFKPTNIQSQEFHATIDKLIKMIPGMNSTISTLLPKIIYGIA